MSEAKGMKKYMSGITVMDMIQQEYEHWLEHAVEDPDIAKELREMAGDDAKIEDAFYRNLEFGTGGLRGVIGVL